ncbi:hypothetical protein Tco_0473885 [Tanacetum coccineum]
MVAFLQKSTGSEEFHQIVDFLADSHISMLLGDISISNADGISSLPNTEIFKQLTLMGYVSNDDKLTFQKDEAQLLRPKPRQAASGQVLKNYQRLSRRLPYQGYPVQARPERVSNLPNEPPLREALITLTKRLKKLEKQLKHKRRRIVIDSSEDEGLSLDAKKDSHQTFYETSKHRFSDKLNAKQVEAQWIANEERIPQEAKQTDEREKVINWNDPDVLSSKKTRGSRKKTLARKRTREKQSKEGAKRQKTEYEKEKEELKAYLDLVPREEFAMKIESLGTKYPIVDWKTHVLTENFMYYQIIRADGGLKNYKIFSEMLDDFDR